MKALCTNSVVIVTHRIPCTCSNERTNERINGNGNKADKLSVSPLSVAPVCPSLTSGQHYRIGFLPTQRSKGNRRVGVQKYTRHEGGRQVLCTLNLNYFGCEGHLRGLLNQADFEAPFLTTPDTALLENDKTSILLTGIFIGRRPV